MKPTMLFTGAGGAATPGLIQRFRGSDFRVLAADMDGHAVGLYLADKGFVIPAGGSSEFLPAMQKICESESVNAVVPLVDEELEACSELEDAGIAVLLPRPKFVNLCLDKLSLMSALAKSEITVPSTRLASTGRGDLGFPLVVKPRSGRGSRGVGIVHNDSELATFLRASEYTPECLLLQEHVDGPEFTVSVVVWRDGNVRAVVPKEVVCKRGITRIAITRRDESIDRICNRVQDSLRADGPFNVQLRIDRSTGEPQIFEINPRFSTTVSLTIAAGIDEVDILLREALGMLPRSTSWQWREDVVLLRRTLDQFITGDEFGNRRTSLVNLHSNARLP